MLWPEALCLKKLSRESNYRMSRAVRVATAACASCLMVPGGRGLLLGRCHVGLENRCGGPHGGRGITAIIALLSISSGPGTV